MADLDRILRSDISHAATRAVELPDFSRIEHRGRQRRRRSRTLFGAAGAAVVLLIGAGSVQVLAGRDAAPSGPGRAGSGSGADGTGRQVRRPG